MTENIELVKILLNKIRMFQVYVNINKISNISVLLCIIFKIKKYMY